MKEIWKDVVGYEGLYKISNKGRVFSLRKNIICKQKLNYRGYPELRLYKNGLKKHYSIHRLVANAFIPNNQNKPQVNHRDCIKTNNKVNNLEWATHFENIKHAVRNKLMSREGQRKLNEKDVLYIRKLRKRGMLIKDIAINFNISCSAINHIVNSYNWGWLK